MQKLLERESQRCQDLLKKSESSVQLGTAVSDDHPNPDGPPNDEDSSSQIKGLESIIQRQNDMIENYRQKVLALEAKVPKI